MSCQWAGSDITTYAGASLSIYCGLNAALALDPLGTMGGAIDPAPPQPLPLYVSELVAVIWGKLKPRNKSNYGVCCLCS
jgi:hypothetical protein